MSDLSQATRPTRARSRDDAGETGGGPRSEVPHVPDPQRDEHVAFPEHDHHELHVMGTGVSGGRPRLARPLPGSAWAGPSKRPTPSLLETPPTYPRRTRTPRKLAAALAAAVTFGALMIGAANHSATVEVTTAGLDSDGQYSDGQYAATVDNGGFVDEGDQSIAAMPLTFTRLRLELAGEGDAQLEVTSSRVTYEQPVSLPLRRNLSGQAARGAPSEL